MQTHNLHQFTKHRVVSFGEWRNYKHHADHGQVQRGFKQVPVRFRECVGVAFRSSSSKFRMKKTYENNFLLLLRIPPKLIPFCDIHMLWKICFKKKKEVYRYTCLGWRAKVGRHHTWLLISCTEPGLPKGHGSELLTPKQKLDSLTLANCGSIDIPTNQVLTLPTTPPGP